VLTDAPEITLDALPEEILSGRGSQRPTASTSEGITVSETLDFRDAKKEFERKYIEKCLDQTGGNVTRAAAMLGMHRQSLQHKIRELGLSKRFVLDD
jgi:DNA-binding NtrC family response regulator